MSDIKEFGRILYIEPNDILEDKSYTNNSSDSSFNITHPYEDYSISVDLIVTVPDRIYNANNSNSTHSIGVSNQNTDKTTTSFFGGKDGWLTDTPGSITYHDITNKNSSDNESLGITNVHISYNSYFYPEVSITFIDVRAASLMMPHEENYKRDLISNGGEFNKVDSFFSALFSFPYPEFKLQVKGFYGKKLEYSLSVSEFRSSFNSQTGNFEATVKFIGRMFGVYTDIPMSLLLIAPYCKYGGMNNLTIWQQKNFQIDEINMPTLVELKEKCLISSYMLPKTISVQDKERYDTLLKMQSELNDIKVEYNELKGSLTNTKVKDNSFSYENTFVYYSSTGEDYFNIIENRRKDLFDRIKTFNDNETYQKKLSEILVYYKIKDFYDNQSAEMRLQLQHITKQLYIEYYGIYPTFNSVDYEINLPDLSIETQVKKITNSNDNHVSKLRKELAIDARNFIDSINEISEEINDEIKEITDRIMKDLELSLSDILGFKPTIKNFFKIIMAHLQVFTEIYNDFINNVTGTNIRSLNEYGLNLDNTDLNVINNSNNISLPPFPSIKNRENVFCYPNRSIVTNKLEEENFIDAFLQSIFDTKKEVEYIENLKNELFSDDMPFMPTMGSDLYLYSENPNYNLYDGIFDDNSNIHLDWLMTYFGIRLVSAFSIERTYKTNNNIGLSIEEFAKCEAYNVWRTCQNLNSDIIDKIAEQNFSDNNFLNFLQNKENPYKINKDNCYYGKGLESIIKEHKISNTIYSSNMGVVEGNSNYGTPGKLYTQKGDFNTYLKSMYDGNLRDDRFLKNDSKNNYPQKFVFISEKHNIENFHDQLKIFNETKNYFNGNPLTNIESQINKAHKYAETKVEFKATLKKEIKDVIDDHLKMLCYTTNIDEFKDLYEFLTTKHTDSVFAIRKSSLLLIGALLHYRSELMTSFDISKYFAVYWGNNNYTYTTGIQVPVTHYQNVRYVINTLLFLTGASDKRYYALEEDLVKNNKNSISYLIDHYTKLNGVDWFENDSTFLQLENRYVDWVKNEYVQIKDAYYKFSNEVQDDDAQTLKNNFSNLFDSTYNDYYYLVCPYKANPILTYENTEYFDGKSDGWYNKYSSFQPLLTDEIKKGFNAFKQELLTLYGRYDTEKEKLYNDKYDALSSSIIGEDEKLSLYYTFKNLYDKHFYDLPSKIDSFNIDKKNSEFDRFHFVDTYWNDLGDDFLINFETVVDALNKLFGDDSGNETLSVNKDMSIYSFMSYLCQRHSMMLLSLPVFNGAFTKEGAINYEDMFTPKSYNDVLSENTLYGPSYVAFYMHKPSQHLDIENCSYKNDGFNIPDLDNTSQNYGETSIPDLMDTESNDYIIPAFAVEYGTQKQSIFTNINVNMDNPQTTEVAVSNLFDLANRGNESPRKVRFKGQDLYQIYSNYSYTCQVDMMGCSQIQPLMYFQLNNIPMFRGAYIIINVEHDITPGNMSTSFKGVRINKTKMPLLKNYMSSINIENMLNARISDIQTNKRLPVNPITSANTTIDLLNSDFEVNSSKIKADLSDYIKFVEGQDNRFDKLNPALQKLIYCIGEQLKKESENRNDGNQYGIYITSTTRNASINNNGKSDHLVGSTQSSQRRKDLFVEKNGQKVSYSELGCAVDFHGTKNGKIDKGFSSILVFKIIALHFTDYIRQLIWEVNANESIEQDKINLIHLASYGKFSGNGSDKSEIFVAQGTNYSSVNESNVTLPTEFYHTLFLLNSENKNNIQAINFKNNSSINANIDNIKKHLKNSENSYWGSFKMEPKV